MFSLLLLILMSDTEVVTPGPRSRAALTAGGGEADAWCPREILLAQHPAARPGVTMLG